jgi:hypothetical protein
MTPGTGPEWLITASTVSRHKTPRAAQAAIDKAIRALRRVPGQSTAYLDWHIRAVEDGHRRPLTGTEWAV